MIICQSLKHGFARIRCVVDLFFYLRGGGSLEGIFEDAETEPMPQMIRRILGEMRRGPLWSGTDTLSWRY